MLYNRLFCQVNGRWMLGLGLLLLLLLSLRVTSRFGVAAGCLLPIPGNKTPEEP